MPTYRYNLELLNKTLDAVSRSADKYGFKVHYALKANNDLRILEMVNQFGLGADCVSGNEVKCAVENGFSPSTIVFAGVGKSDDEILYAIAQDIFCFNCESLQELYVINGIASSMGSVVKVALRINPDVDARTHQFISTGKAHSKFGISHFELESIVNEFKNWKNIEIVGIHFHIGSQITNYDVFEELCKKVNLTIEWFEAKGIVLQHINLGGGVGIDYENPDENLIIDFDSYFSIFDKGIMRKSSQHLHFELGRSIVGQCGELITKVLYRKILGDGTNVLVVDAGMNDLMRPALYGAKHKIVNLSSNGDLEKYTIVGPICESSDVFYTDIMLPSSHRGDILSIKSTGAYGASMSSAYNMRQMAEVEYVM